MSQYDAGSGSGFKSSPKSINAMGAKPMTGGEGNNGTAPLGCVRPTGVVATGRYGGSKDQKRPMDKGRKTSGR